MNVLRTDIATVLTSSTPLFALARRGVAEVVIAGVSYLKIEGQKLGGPAHLSVDGSVMLIARSLLKPWQFLAADVNAVLRLLRP